MSLAQSRSQGKNEARFRGETIQVSGIPEVSRLGETADPDALKSLAIAADGVAGCLKGIAVVSFE